MLLELGAWGGPGGLRKAAGPPSLDHFLPQRDPQALEDGVGWLEGVCDPGSQLFGSEDRSAGVVSLGTGQIVRGVHSDRCFRPGSLNPVRWRSVFTVLYP